jgi:hypothetical protein
MFPGNVPQIRRPDGEYHSDESCCDATSGLTRVYRIAEGALCSQLARPRFDPPGLRGSSRTGLLRHSLFVRMFRRGRGRSGSEFGMTHLAAGVRDPTADSQRADGKDERENRQGKGGFGEFEGQ